jgi:hypothetical protein
MSNHKLFAVALFLTLAFSIAAPSVRADERNQKTKLTFTEAVEIPGEVLPAGTYWFILFNNDSQRNLVQVFSADWSVLYATMQTVPREIQQPNSETTLTFAERPASEPQAILTWFYPYETIGHEFIYSKSEEQELSRDRHQQVAVEAGGTSPHAGGE